MRRVTFIAHVPAKAPAVHLCGSLPQLGSWRAEGVVMEGKGARRWLNVAVPEGVPFEYKFTLGGWHREASDPLGRVLWNFRAVAGHDLDLEHRLDAFLNWNIWPASALPWPKHEPAVLKRWAPMKSRFLRLRHRVAVWLPPNYEKEKGRRYPVLYMHDGQNVFDGKTSYAGVDWGIDEALTDLMAHGRIPPMIAVGIWNTRQRNREYDPFTYGPAYARFLIEELMPRVNRKFRTLPGPDFTGTMGSSQGGIAALFLGWRYPHIFGRVGALSCHYPSRGGALINQIIASGGYPRNVRLYLDHGTKGPDRAYAPLQKKLAASLEAWGWVRGRDFRAEVAQGTDHTEGAWRARVRDPLGWLFASV